MLNRSTTWRYILMVIAPTLCNAHESLDANLWMQTAAEYRVLVEQIFRQAQRYLPAALTASTNLGAIENHPEAASKKPAVIVDIDETILDNSPFQAQAIVRGQHGFDLDAWNDWVMSHKAEALPGALEYVRTTRDRGVEVFYITNRACTNPQDCPQQEAVIRNLTELGFPDVDDARLLMKNEQPTWSSEKSSRRAEIAKHYRIVQLIGDDLGDFIPAVREANPQTRLAMAAQYQERFGYTWYLLPNPLYGSWKNALGEFPVSHLQPDLEQLCLQPNIPIGHIQGPGDASYCVGLKVTTRGIVTLVSVGRGGLGGYFIQDVVGDGNAATADGIFVVDKTDQSEVSRGDLIEIQAQVAELDGLTALQPEGSGAVTILSRKRRVRPTVIRLPESFDGELERYEGMLVSLPQVMTVTGNRWLDDLGQLKLASADAHGRLGRLYQPTHLAVPGSPEAKRVQGENARRLLVLDDGKGLNPDSLPFVGKVAKNITLRVGDQVTNILGVLDYGKITRSGSGHHRFDYRIQAMQAPTILSGNHRPSAPVSGDRHLRIVNANVNNFFTQLGRGQCPAACEEANRSNCRGALNKGEFQRQTVKLAAALSALDADIYGFQEVQNNGFGKNSAIAALTQLLGDDYDFIRTREGHIGCDAISVGFAYKNTVRPAGKAHVFANGPLDAVRQGANRSGLAQVFEHIATGERITVVVNHFKSRRAPNRDTDDADSQNDNGYWNLRLTEAAQHLVWWLKDLAEKTDPDIVIIGDLNAYAREDPLQVLETAGYINLLKPIAGDQTPAYTYIYDGLAGALDHVLVSGSLADQASAFIWPINADEPKVMDYRLGGLGTTWFHETPFRASDHDPVILDITFAGVHP